MFQTTRKNSNLLWVSLKNVWTSGIVLRRRGLVAGDPGNDLERVFTFPTRPSKLTRCDLGMAKKAPKKIGWFNTQK